MAISLSIPFFQKEEPKIPETEKEIARDYIKEWIRKPSSTEKNLWTVLGRRTVLNGISTDRWKYRSSSVEVQNEELRRLEKALKSDAFGTDTTIRSQIIGYLLSRILHEIPDDLDRVALTE